MYRQHRAMNTKMIIVGDMILSFYINQYVVSLKSSNAL